LTWIGDMLSDGRPYLLGDKLSLADCVVYHAIWIMDQLAYRRVALIPAGVRDWMDRVAAHGHGSPTPMSALEALDVAAAAKLLPSFPSEALEGDPARFQALLAPFRAMVDAQIACEKSRGGGPSRHPKKPSRALRSRERRQDLQYSENTYIPAMYFSRNHFVSR